LKLIHPAGACCPICPGLHLRSDRLPAAGRPKYTSAKDGYLFDLGQRFVDAFVYVGGSFGFQHGKGVTT